MSLGTSAAVQPGTNHLPLRTRVEWDASLGRTVHVFSTIEEALDNNPADIYRRAEMLVVDDPGWKTDLKKIWPALIPQRRKFKEPFNAGAVSPEVAPYVKALTEEIDAVFDRLFPDFGVTDRQASFRPMITGPEPIHFDTRGSAADIPFVTSFVNISRVPRVYKIGQNLHQLIASHPDLMREVLASSKGMDVSFELRVRTQKNLPPLDDKSPKHTVHLAPGSIWFFDAKTVAHEVFYGEGVLARGAAVPNSRAPQQPDILKALVQA